MTEELHICGRPTRSGAPCQVKLTGSETVCGIHAETRASGDTIVYEVGGDQIGIVSELGIAYTGTPAFVVDRATGNRVTLN